MNKMKMDFGGADMDMEEWGWEQKGRSESKRSECNKVEGMS